MRDPPVTPAPGEVLRLPGYRGTAGQIDLSTVPRPKAERHIEIGAEFGRRVVVSEPREGSVSVVDKLSSKAVQVSVAELRSKKRTDPEWKLKAECIRLHAQLMLPEWRDAFPIAIWRNKSCGLRADYMPYPNETIVEAAFVRTTTLSELFEKATKGLSHG